MKTTTIEAFLKTPNAVRVLGLFFTVPKLDPSDIIKGTDLGNTRVSLALRDLILLEVIERHQTKNKSFVGNDLAYYTLNDDNLDKAKKLYEISLNTIIMEDVLREDKVKIEYLLKKKELKGMMKLFRNYAITEGFV